MGLLRQILGISRDKYSLEALVSMRHLEKVALPGRSVHIICDLDKTYVETEFESWAKMARIPFEGAHEKITVPGASEVLLAARWGQCESREQTITPGLHFVSSSPPQLRPVLEGKLVLDQLDWTTDTFKNQTYNLRMARVDLLRHHIAFKSQAILRIISDMAPGSSIWMIGDNAEYDPYVYVGIKLLVEKHIDISGFAAWLRAAHVESRVIAQLVKNFSGIQDNLRIAGILIRRLVGYSVVEMLPISKHLYLFENWLQVGWLWLCDGLIPASRWWSLLRAFHNVHGVPLEHIEWILTASLNKLDQNHRVQPSLEDAIAKIRILRGAAPPRKSLDWAFEGLHAGATPDLSQQLIQDMGVQWYANIEKARALRGSKNR